MSFWHILIVLLVLPGGEEQIVITLPFPDEFSCGEALPHLAQAVGPEYPDSVLLCRPTALASAIFVRPQARPN